LPPDDPDEPDDPEDPDDPDEPGGFDPDPLPCGSVESVDVHVVSPASHGGKNK
jgi:hypothetical protein